MYDLEGALDESRARSIGMKEDRAPRARAGESEMHIRALRVGLLDVQAFISERDIEVEGFSVVDIEVEHGPDAVAGSRFRSGRVPANDERLKIEIARRLPSASRLRITFSRRVSSKYPTFWSKTISR